MTYWLKVLGILGATAFFFAHVPTTNGQSAESLSQVKKVFVDSLGTGQGAAGLREAVIKALRKNTAIVYAGRVLDWQKIVIPVQQRERPGPLTTSQSSPNR